MLTTIMTYLRRLTMKTYRWNIFKKGYDDFTLADAMYAMSLGLCCMCGDGKVLYMQKE